jgi:hypothetical protein
MSSTAVTEPLVQPAPPPVPTRLLNLSLSQPAGLPPRSKRKSLLRQAFLGLGVVAFLGVGGTVGVRHWTSLQ